jgi:glycosyltransferase involved in cell wall biosynthesis
MIEKMEYPLFTVIIPQKNREEFIAHTLKTCMIQDYPNFEIIVSDDCSEDNSVGVIKELAKIDSRIKLFAHQKHLGMRENFEFALHQVKSGYVISLGGDDGLVPGSIWKMYNILTFTKKELLTWPHARFSYPIKKNGNNIFYIKRKKNKGVKIIDSTHFLNKLTENFLYQIDECPMIYIKGVASIEIINKVKSRTPDNCFYSCPTPDGFSGIVLAGEVENYAYTNEPLSIGGNSIKSQGANYRRTDKNSKIEALQFFNDNIQRTMHKDLASQPYSPLEPLMTADYLLTARDLPGWPGKFKPFSFEALIRASFRFLEKSNYENEVLIRELKIIRNIAIQHELVDLFEKLMKSTKRKVIRAENVYGFAITNSIRFDGKELGIENIYDASLATNFVYNFYNKFSIKMLVNLIKNTYKIIRRTKRYDIEQLPQIDN